MMKRPVILAITLLCGLGAGYAVSSLTAPDYPQTNLYTDSSGSNQGKAETHLDTAKLKAELDAARRYIAYLHQANNDLLSKIKDKKSNSLPGNMPSDLMGKLESLPESIVIYQLEQILGEDAVSEISDARNFSKRALEVALDNSEISAENATASIVFSTSPVRDIRPFSGSVSVDQYDIIFAHINTTNSLGRLLVKWQNTNTGQILMFNDRFVADESSAHYVSFRPSTGWQPGTYRVSIHQFNDKLTPIGSNSYSIVTVNEGEYDGEGRNDRLIQEMLNSGQAVYKQ